MKSVVVLGMFDGVHIGHTELLLCAKRLAAAGLVPIVYTFSNHPADLFCSTKQRLILTNDERTQKIKSILPFCNVVCEPFSEALAALSPTEFVRMLSDRFSPEYAVVGFNYTFGKNKSGTAETLKLLGSKNGFVTKIMPPVLYGGALVSSTRIRSCIENGDVGAARSMLNAPFSITATVVENKHIGRRIGFPTANIVDVGKKPVPRFGVYATMSKIDGRVMPSVTNVGNNPTFGENAFSVETHIFDCNDNLYGKTMTVEFIDFIREQRKFFGAEELADQINNDKRKALELL